MFKSHWSKPLRRFACPISILSLGTLAGCGTTQSVPSAPEAASASSSAPSSTPSKPTLLEEQRRLAGLFRGTPVVFSMQTDGGLRVEIPTQFCFDEGQTKVKPPLAAVLDRLARSQANETTHVAVAAPVDPTAKNQALGVDRAVSVRKYLVAHGIAETRFVAVTVTSNGSLRIIVANVALP
jgi:outer membrane protein OmpA-like peptidoglycan-associated protein